MSSRLKFVRESEDSQVPSGSPAAAIRDRLAVERRRLDAMEPRALDMAAEVLAALHDPLRGELSHLAGDRTPRYRRAQLLGEIGLPIEDLCYLKIHRPEVVAAAIRPLVDGVEHDHPVTVGVSFAGLAEVAGHALARLLFALEDGTLTLAEVADLRRILDELEHFLVEARTALAEASR